MENLINEIYEIVKDYRQDEEKMSPEHISNWILQFDGPDRIFLLTELKHLLEQRYFSKELIEKALENIIIAISKKYGFETPKSFLSVSSFIKHQPEGKSQSDFLKLLYDISISKFDFDIEDNEIENPKYYIYIDDILCTGDSLFKCLIKQEEDEIVGGWLFEEKGDKSNLDYLKSNNAQLLILNFVIHQFNYFKCQSRIYMALDKTNIEKYYTAWAFLWVENNPKITSSKFDLIFPVKDENEEDVMAYCDKMEVDNHAFRDADRPIEETFFSSNENRNRFESIILKKSVFLFDQAGEGRNARMRPLGYGLRSHKNLGFGAFCITYRNIPFNMPLVFWYQGHGWTPLFERYFSNY